MTERVVLVRKPRCRPINAGHVIPDAAQVATADGAQDGAVKVLRDFIQLAGRLRLRCYRAQQPAIHAVEQAFARRFSRHRRGKDRFNRFSPQHRQSDRQRGGALAGEGDRQLGSRGRKAGGVHARKFFVEGRVHVTAFFVRYCRTSLTPIASAPSKPSATREIFTRPCIRASPKRITPAE